MRVKPWIKLGDSLLQQTRVFDLRVQRMLAPDKSHEDDYFYISTRDWVNVIPLTSDGQVVLVEQFRHGINEISLETPGGLVDEGDTPEQSAFRELSEETGYVAESLEHLGTLRPNPAMLNNSCYFYLARNVELKSEQHLDPSEDISLVTCPLQQIPELILSGQISHTVVAAAFFLYSQKMNLFGK